MTKTNVLQLFVFGDFVGLAPGWFAGKGKVVSLEDVRDNLGRIMDEKNYIVPTSVGDEMRLIAKDLLG